MYVAPIWYYTVRYPFLDVLANLSLIAKLSLSLQISLRRTKQFWLSLFTLEISKLCLLLLTFFLRLPRETHCLQPAGQVRWDKHFISCRSFPLSQVDKSATIITSLLCAGPKWDTASALKLYSFATFPLRQDFIFHHIQEDTKRNIHKTHP